MKNIQLWKLCVNFALFLFYIFGLQMLFKKKQCNLLLNSSCKKKLLLVNIDENWFKKIGNCIRIWLKICFPFFMQLLLSLLQSLFEQNHPWQEKSSLNHTWQQTWWLTDVSLNIWILVTYLAMNNFRWKMLYMNYHVSL